MNKCLHCQFESSIPYSQKIWQGLKFGSLVVGVETTKLKSANIILAAPATRKTYVIHAVALLAPPGTPFHKLYIANTLPVIFLVNSQTHGFVQVPKVRGRQRSSTHSQCL